MKKLLYIVIISSIIFSCAEKDNKESLESETLIDSLTIEDNADTTLIKEDAQVWLKKSIEGYFEGKLNLEKICTPEYLEFKLDAVSVDTDTGISEEALLKKWKNRRSVKWVGLGSGFFISGQDWRKIKVSSARLKDIKENGYLVYATNIQDLDFNANYKRDIILKPVNNSFLIDDVIEFE